MRSSLSSLAKAVKSYKGEGEMQKPTWASLTDRGGKWHTFDQKLILQSAKATKKRYIYSILTNIEQTWDKIACSFCSIFFLKKNQLYACSELNSQPVKLCLARYVCACICLLSSMYTNGTTRIVKSTELNRYHSKLEMCFLRRIVMAINLPGRID